MPAGGARPPEEKVIRFHHVVGIAALAGGCGSALASLTLLSSPPPLTHPGNLVTNGSFETGAPSPDGSAYYWATGTTLSFNPFAVPGGWSSAGTASTYATWGNDGAGPAHKQFSDVLPDGRNALYFGNADTTVNQAPTYHADGTVTFASAPTFSPQYGGPCRLWQTINTVANPAPSYRLSFWASAEAAQFGLGAYSIDGIFGLKVTNVLPGDPIQYLTAPDGTTAIGMSHVYEYQFVPLNALLPVTIEFINWGHIDLGGGMAGSELVLDDVIVKTAPAPGVLGAGLIGTCGALVRRRR